MEKEFHSVGFEHNRSSEVMSVGPSVYTFETNYDIILISPKSTMEISLKTKNKIDVNNLTFYVLNAITAPKKYLEINLKL